MADEENPLGGGIPFGVGPFGPLVGVAAVAAAATFSMVVTTTSSPAPKTLFYQANIAPPPVAPPIPARAETFSVTSGGVSTRNLHYQSRIYGIAPPVEVVVPPITIDKWQQPFTRAVQRPPTETGLYTPFVPSAFPQPNVAWLQPFKRQVAGPFPVHTQPVLGFAAAPQPTPDEWLQPFQRAVPTPPVHHTQPVSGYQPEVVVSNLTTTLEWLQPFQKAVPQPRPALSQPVFGYPYEAQVVSNLTTTLEWMQAWRGPPRVQPVHTQPVHAHLLPNLTTTLEWQIAWQKAVPAPRPIHTQPVFGYPYPSIANARTAWDWSIAWQKAVPVPPVHHTQPDLGYPPAAIANTRTEWDWPIQWQGPPRTLQRLAAGAGFSLPPSNYRNEWDWPLAWNLAAKAPKPVHTQPVSGYPYVAIQNTITGIAWLRGFEKAVPAPPVRHTQPVFGYPYVAVQPPSNLTTTLEWLQKWQNPPRATQRLAAGPVLPPAATPTIANTITGIGWLQGFQRVKPQRPVHTQPVLGRSDAARLDVAWLRGFDRQVAARPVRPTQPPFVYSPPAVVSNLTTTLEWQQPLSVAVKARPVRPTQPDYGLFQPEAAEAEAFLAASVTNSQVFRRTLFYQATVFPPYPYVQVEPEPGVCIPAFQWQGGFQFSAFQTCQDEQGEAPLPPTVPKFSHGQIRAAAARTDVSVVYPGMEQGACVPGFQQAGFQSDAFQVCSTEGQVCIIGFQRTGFDDGFQICQGTAPPEPPRRHLRTTRAMTSTRWKRSRGSIRSRGKSRTTPRDDP